MKTNKTYIKTSLALQILLIPILLTVGLFISFSVFQGELLPQTIGQDTSKLIHLLMAFFTPLLVGMMMGFIFKRNIRSKLDSMKGIYIASIIPILYALIFALLAVVISPKDYNSTWWGIYLFKNPAFLLFHFLLFFAGTYHFAIVAELMSYTGFALGVCLDELVSKVNLHKDNSLKIKRIYIFSMVLSILIPIGFSAIITRDIISNGIIEIRYGKSTIGEDLNEYDLYDIAPFKENNGLAKLDQTASLQFEDFDDMPRLDGATAAYPVYAAFVESVYKGLGDYYKSSFNETRKDDGTAVAYPVDTNIKNNNEKDLYSAFVSSDHYPFSIVQCTKTETAYERLIKGDVDIIFVAEPSKAHREEIKEKNDEFVLTTIGYEAFVFFTNAKNPIEDLKIEQIQGIYSGDITNWREVGGQNRRILPFQRPENSGSQTIMQNQVMKDIKMLPPTEETYAGGMGTIISQVANYKNARNALGYSFMYYSSEMVNNNQIKHISIEGIQPSPENIRNKTYPFTVPVYAVTLKSNKDRNVRVFIEWIQSEEGQSLIEKTGYVGR